MYTNTLTAQRVYHPPLTNLLKEHIGAQRMNNACTATSGTPTMAMARQNTTPCDSMQTLVFYGKQLFAILFQAVLCLYF